MNTVFNVRSILLTLLLSFCFTSLAFSAQKSTDLKIDLPEHVQIFSLKDLKRKLKTVSVTVDDPVYGAKKTYEGFYLSDILKQAGLTTQSAGFDELIFHCADGYSPAMKFSDYSFAEQNKSRAILAIREKGDPKKGSVAGWIKFKQGKAEMTPAPYYLVWQKSDKIAVDPVKFPWPYQLIGIELVQFKEKFSQIYPEGIQEDSKVFQGFIKFKGDCLRCHSLNLHGGTIGPELNIPKNITEYRDGKILKDFIRNASSFRAKSKMPSFSKWKDEEIESVIEYLKWMKDHKVE